ncbi:putative alpha beta hydrolase fold family protein [Lyophyllum shimeji]|uniref:Alpha beta hydrolase fold family protein n=1 Tax=Lyophyllum shimeji TaxID=47721 RepID=A0A9P3Q221_LYOSH|nr:putative alpha beta hydrolase fold family protein [Lyophyllum shimeji]
MGGRNCCTGVSRMEVSLENLRFMFPDKIERMVIDGVVDIKNYYKTLWSTNLIDTDKTMNAFFTYCHAVGPSDCPFYAPTPDLIAANLTALYDSVKARPVPVRTRNSYGLVDYNRLRVTMFSSLYSPWAMWAPVAHGLAALARGDGAPLYSLLETPSFQCECGEADGEPPIVRDAATAIVCNDGDPVPDAFKELEKYFEEMTSKSGWAEIWAGIRTACVGWPDIPKARFRGPFEANTSFPLLVVGNTADPVTPLWARRPKDSECCGFDQDSPGHCSISAPSVCTQTYIRDYFVNGTLPPPGTVCPIVGTPFPDSGASLHQKNVKQEFLGGEQAAEETLALSVDDQAVLHAVKKLSESYKLPRMF